MPHTSYSDTGHWETCNRPTVTSELAAAPGLLTVGSQSYSDILQRLVRRYMFKLERQKEEGFYSALSRYVASLLLAPLHFSSLSSSKTCVVSR